MRLRLLLILTVLHSTAFADLEMTFDDGSMALVRGPMVMFGDAQSAVLYNSRNDDLVIIDQQDRSWMRLEAEFFKVIAAQMKKEMEELLASIPPEQRPMVEEQMQGMIPQEPEREPTIEVQRTGSTDRVAGYDCQEAEVTIAGGDNAELVCIATMDELGINQADFATLNSAMRSIARIAMLNPNSGSSADFARMGGVPIRTHNLQQDYQTALTAIQYNPIDASRLSIPADFRQTTLEEMLAR